MVLGATNFPENLEDAVLSRFQKKIYLKLPNKNARFKLLKNELAKIGTYLESDKLKKLAQATELYSYRDFDSMIKAAAQFRISELSQDEIEYAKPEDLRPISYGDLEKAIKLVKAGSSKVSIEKYKKFYGDGYQTDPEEDNDFSIINPGTQFFM